MKRDILDDDNHPLTHACRAVLMRKHEGLAFSEYARRYNISLTMLIQACGAMEAIEHFGGVYGCFGEIDYRVLQQAGIIRDLGDRQLFLTWVLDESPSVDRAISVRRRMAVNGWDLDAAIFHCEAEAEKEAKDNITAKTNRMFDCLAVISDLAQKRASHEEIMEQTMFMIRLIADLSGQTMMYLCQLMAMREVLGELMTKDDEMEIEQAAIRVFKEIMQRESEAKV